MTFKASGVALPDLYEASIVELQDGLVKRHFTSVQLVKAYLNRIEEVNLKGPALHAVIETNPIALSQAAALDDERKGKGGRGPLHGIPLLLKDNIATLHEEGMNTTAGSYALLGSVVPRDAFAAAQLREAGAIFIGKSNLSEWSGMRGEWGRLKGQVPNGLSERGGQTFSPYYPNAHPSSSSSGSGVAMAIGLAAGSLGSDTHGSIVFPSSRNNIVGIKPTIGLVSRSGVIPISSHQDTLGPMCRSVTDAALLLNFMAGPDPRDEVTLRQPGLVPDYMKALDKNALKGARLGVPRSFIRNTKVIEETFNSSLDVFRALGAEIVDPADFPDTEELLTSKAEKRVLDVDFKVDLNKYLSELVDVPTGVKTLAALIEFSEKRADLNLPPPFYNDQSQYVGSNLIHDILLARISRFKQSEASQVDDAYFSALAEDFDLGRTRGIDVTLAQFNLDAIILPTEHAPGPAAIAGYPLISVPLGFQPDDVELLPVTPSSVYTQAPGLPFGIAFMGTAYSEFKLIGYAYAFEQATHVRLQRKAYEDAIPRTQLTDVMSQL
ncbi:amidase signature domain-containing protein [Suillus fuscotomentosus]|uniref:Amidase signature domain-containing protein n=1 Tax=Suillus fuscotomentosus TaxID=1912939 RepID=A0AAD4HP14_9AGAM|nr:amidase signature domain-containing protein [Suillus fuscotomentosus]KAG1903688.1 amidase signature domain-containing protein [Suillus fuscotomentosus]